MRYLRFSAGIAVAGLIALWTASLCAQTNCNEGAGPIAQAQPTGITTGEIIKKFAARESEFAEAITHYTFTMEVSVQTLAGEQVDGEFRRVSDIKYTQGKRFEYVVFAPQSSLRRISMSKQDFDDLNRSPFILTTEDLPQYDVMYAGQQKVDLLDTYVFEVAPRQIVSGKHYFQGKIWVETRDLALVKSCGKTVPEEDPEAAKQRAKKKRRVPGGENVSPTLATYRQEFEHKYWFPVYVRSDEALHFSYGDDVHLREIIKYTKYNRADSAGNTASTTKP